MLADLTDTQGYVFTEMLKKHVLGLRLFPKQSFLSLFVSILSYFIIKTKRVKLQFPVLQRWRWTRHPGISGLPLYWVWPFSSSTCRGRYDRLWKPRPGWPPPPLAEAAPCEWKRYLLFTFALGELGKEPWGCFQSTKWEDFLSATNHQRWEDAFPMMVLQLESIPWAYKFLLIYLLHPEQWGFMQLDLGLKV